MQLTDKVTLITGAGSGMGRATAELFAAQGATVIAVDLNESAAQGTLERIGGAAAGIARACDIADSRCVEQLFEEVARRWGRVDVLVNNAGVGQVPGDGLEKYQERLVWRQQQLAAGEEAVHTDMVVDLTDAGWQRVIDINLNGAFFCSREAVRLMIRAGVAGSIVNIASVSALTGEGPLSYCASKAALLGLTKCLARDLGPRGIRVNAICPGPTRTPMMQTIPEEWARSLEQAIPLGRMSEPEEIAKAVLFLASDDGSCFTGQTLSASGGMYMI
ncbi:SDR family NAD(P)-dependent oxidoreductase [Crenobacter sp. SG2305]|uniref:SDR family NAD(P)-dependent oxidoreductase n=1 Tax=Crenobacter oryzisoli TaxID=3056844 RepID=UPI0025AAD991|nr:SDR family NAD(P)-dependent oxidoreductase [Crenobacter sp. SG2305]MDN0084517.1 SDR family NAD(P)-dependent oxidoreductase [Crenobacter sp. SG2305]